MANKFEKRFDCLLKLAENQSKSIHELLKLQTFNKLENIFTSKDVELNCRDNWIRPVASFVKPCRACGYYGHTQKSCKNILPSYKLSCSRCWQSSHNKDKCLSSKRDTPFCSEYIQPEKLLKKYLKSPHIDNEESNSTTPGRTYSLILSDEESEDQHDAPPPL
nr:655_t:CDS:2 [Entrophospora candida]